MAYQLVTSNPKWCSFKEVRNVAKVLGIKSKEMRSASLFFDMNNIDTLGCKGLYDQVVQALGLINIDEAVSLEVKIESGCFISATIIQYEFHT